MGASTDYRVFNYNDKSKIKSEWDAEVEQSKREDGYSYSGQIGMLGSIGGWKNLKFSTQEQAGDALFELHDKWSDALAVSFLLEAKKDVERIISKSKTRQYFLKYICNCPEPHNSIRSGRRSLNVNCGECGYKFVVFDS